MLKAIGIMPGVRFGSGLADRACHLKSVLASLLLVGLLSHPLMADKPEMSPQELRAEATHVVVGKVIKIDCQSARKGDLYETTYRATVKITRLEKGLGLRVDSYVYVHYGTEEWLGEIGPDDRIETGDHTNRPHEGQTLRIYMKGNRHTAGGSSLKGKNKQNDFNVLLPNGFQELQFETKTVSHSE